MSTNCTKLIVATAAPWCKVAASCHDLNFFLESVHLQVLAKLPQSGIAALTNVESGCQVNISHEAPLPKELRLELLFIGFSGFNVRSQGTIWELKHCTAIYCHHKSALLAGQLHEKARSTSGSSKVLDCNLSYSIEVH